MTKIVIMGAGGKMGVRLATNLMQSNHEVFCVEVDPEGQKRLRDATGLKCIAQSQALSDAEVIILALPDRLIGKVLSEFVHDHCSMMKQTQALKKTILVELLLNNI